MIEPWKRIETEDLNDYRIFRTRRDRSVSPDTGIAHDFYVIESNDWINVIPVTPDEQVIMIRQYRHGIRQNTLEIPGGICEEDETPVEAATRELLEETGYTPEEMVPLGWVHPNPAIQENLCHIFLARNVRSTSSPTPDETEELETIAVPMAEMGPRLAAGEFSHALVVTAFAQLLMTDLPEASTLRASWNGDDGVR